MLLDGNAEEKLPSRGSTDHSVLTNLKFWQSRCIIFDMLDDNGSYQDLEAI